MHARVIGIDKSHTAVDALIGKGKHRIGRHVETDHLHGRERPDAAHGCPDSRFDGNFFIRSPFGVDFIIPGYVFQDFCTRRARVSRCKADACFIEPAGNRFITRK